MNHSEITSIDTDQLLARVALGETRIAELEARLAEAEQTLQAIRTGEIDALVVSGPDGDQIFTLEGADHAYRLLVEEMQEGTITLNADGLILYSNRQFASMMKTPAQTIVGSHINRFLAPDRTASFFALLPDSETKCNRGELTLIAADGAAVPAQLSLNRLKTGGIQTTCVVIADLTEQRRYEAMVKDGNLSRLILDQVAEAIIVIDAHGKILRASESACQLAGRDIVLQPFDGAFQLWEAQQRLDTSRLISAVRSGNPSKSIEVKLVPSDRPHLTLLLSVGPLWTNSHELLGCVITMTDITARKESEVALARQAHELERSNDDLKQFAYAASHDLREPIRIVTSYTQLFEKKYKDHLDERARGMIQHTVDAAQRLETLLDDLLAYAQTAEEPGEAVSPVDANMVLAKTLTVFETAIAESGGQVQSDPLPKLRVHEVHLQQVFQNLIGNSLKYRGEAPPRIHLSAEPGRGMWTLTLADNGIGIDPQYHTQIFGLFKRLNVGRKYAGSGIGLAICNKIVERYGGRIWVESEAGRGSKFYFTMPGEIVSADPAR